MEDADMDLLLALADEAEGEPAQNLPQAHLRAAATSNRATSEVVRPSSTAAQLTKPPGPSKINLPSAPVATPTTVSFVPGPGYKPPARQITDGYVDSISGFRVSKPVIGSLVLKERLTDDCVYMALKDISPSRELTGRWATMGVLVGKVQATGRDGSSYSRWTLSDLAGKQVTLFLWRKAAAELYKEVEGSLLLLWSAQVRRDEGGGSGGAGFSLHIDKPEMVQRPGMSSDFGFCRGTKKDGQRCTNPINKSACEYCPYHAQAALRALSSHRSDMAGANLLQRQLLPQARAAQKQMAGEFGRPMGGINTLIARPMPPPSGHRGSAAAAGGATGGAGGVRLGAAAAGGTGAYGTDADYEGSGGAGGGNGAAGASGGGGGGGGKRSYGAQLLANLHERQALEEAGGGPAAKRRRSDSDPNMSESKARAIAAARAAGQLSGQRSAAATPGSTTSGRPAQGSASQVGTGSGAPRTPSVQGPRLAANPPPLPAHLASLLRPPASQGPEPKAGGTGAAAKEVVGAAGSQPPIRQTPVGGAGAAGGSSHAGRPARPTQKPPVSSKAASASASAGVPVRGGSGGQAAAKGAVAARAADIGNAGGGAAGRSSAQQQGRKDVGTESKKEEKKNDDNDGEQLMELLDGEEADELLLVEEEEDTGVHQDAAGQEGGSGGDDARRRGAASDGAASAQGPGAQPGGDEVELYLGEEGEEEKHNAAAAGGSQAGPCDEEAAAAAAAVAAGPPGEDGGTTGGAEECGLDELLELFPELREDEQAGKVAGAAAAAEATTSGGAPQATAGLLPRVAGLVVAPAAKAAEARKQQAAAAKARQEKLKSIGLKAAAAPPAPPKPLGAANTGRAVGAYGNGQNAGAAAAAALAAAKGLPLGRVGPKAAAAGAGAGPRAAAGAGAMGPTSALAAAFGSLASQLPENAIESRYSELSEDAAGEAVLSMLEGLEARDALVQQLDSVSHLKVSAWHCAQCDRLFEFLDKQCRADGHTLTKTSTLKRFWKCDHCSARVTTLGVRFPASRCSRCNNPSLEFTACTMYRGPRELKPAGMAAAAGLACKENLFATLEQHPEMGRRTFR